MQKRDDGISHDKGYGIVEKRNIIGYPYGKDMTKDKMREFVVHIENCMRSELK